MKRLLLAVAPMVLAACAQSGGQAALSPNSAVARLAIAKFKPASCSGPMMWVGGGTDLKHLIGYDSCGNKDWDISGSNTKIGGRIESIAQDPTNGDILVTPDVDNGIAIFQPGQNGNVAPYERLDSPKFCLSLHPPCTPSGSYAPVVNIATDQDGNILAGILYVNGGTGLDGHIYRFNQGDNGLNVSPDKTFIANEYSPGATSAIGTDRIGHVYVVQLNTAVDDEFVFKFRVNDSGSVTPGQALKGNHVFNAFCNPVAITATDDGQIYVADTSSPANGCNSDGRVLIWNEGDSGNMAPDAAIYGTTSGLVEPSGVKISGLNDSHAIYVSDYGSGDTFKYAAGTTGNMTAPEATYTMANAIELTLCPSTSGSSSYECSSMPSIRRRP